jgi:hypothetical protein
MFAPKVLWWTVVTVNVALLEPAATVTVAGGIASEGCDEVRVTTHPPAGAGFAKVTVPCVEVPAMKVVGEIEKALSFVGSTVNSAEALPPP